MPPRKVQPQPQGETEPSNDDSAEPTQPFKVADIPIETRKDMLTAQIKRAKIELRDGYEAGRHNRQGHCPACGGGPKKDNNFQVNIAEDYTFAKWWCYRAKGCGKEGYIPLVGEPKIKTTTDNVQLSPRAASSGPRSLDDPAPAAAWARPASLDTEAAQVRRMEDAPQQILNFLRDRGVDPEVARKAGVGWVYRQGDASPALAFRYFKDGKVVNIKYRYVHDKIFWQSPGGYRMLYGLEAVAPDAKTLIIVEGEMDRLAFEQAGIANVVSIPDGAVNKAKDEREVEKAVELGKDDPDAAGSIDRKFAYLWNAMPVIERMEEIVIATDADKPGQLMAEELARRIGKEKCYRARFDRFVLSWKTDEKGQEVPETTCKDANDVLMHLGSQQLVDSIQEAAVWPIDGLFTLDAFRDEIFQLFEGNVDSAEFGVRTGWDGVDAYYKVVPGELTIVTGVPNSGKSEWIDALMVNLAMLHGWSFGLCSMENRVRDHARKLAEKYSGKSFYSQAWYSTDKQRVLSRADLEKALDWLQDHFCIIRHDSDAMPDIDWVLDRAKQAVVRYGIRGLVIDPYNELEHRRPSNQTETEYVSQLLSKVKRFCQNYGVHVWFVAHPKQLANWNPDTPPGLYEISGSAHFVNKADNGVVVHRYRSDDKLNNVEIHVKKVRNKLAGSIGFTKLDYDAVSGRYTEKQEYIDEATKLRALEQRGSSAQQQAVPATTQLGEQQAPPQVAAAPPGEEVMQQQQMPPVQPPAVVQHQQQQQYYQPQPQQGYGDPPSAGAR